MKEIKENETWENKGFVKLYRSILDNPLIHSNPDKLSVYIHLLLYATHTKMVKVFDGKNIQLKPGQLVTGRKFLAKETGLCESKVSRILETLESEHLILQNISSKSRLISMTYWDDEIEQKHESEQQVNNSRTTSEQQVNNKRTTSEQQVNTYNNVKNEKKEENVCNKFLEKTHTDFLNTKKEENQDQAIPLGKSLIDLPKRIEPGSVFSGNPDNKESVVATKPETMPLEIPKQAFKAEMNTQGKGQRIEPLQPIVATPPIKPKIELTEQQKYDWKHWLDDRASFCRVYYWRVHNQTDLFKDFVPKNEDLDAASQILDKIDTLAPNFKEFLPAFMRQWINWHLSECKKKNLLTPRFLWVSGFLRSYEAFCEKEVDDLYFIRLEAEATTRRDNAERDARIKKIVDKQKLMKEKGLA